MRRDDKLYIQSYGDIPNNALDRIQYILGKKVSNVKFNKEIERIANRIKRIKKHSIQFTMWKEFKPSARPRVNNRGAFMQMYVPHARENGEWFEAFAKDSNLPFIETPCILNVDIYEKSPKNFSIAKKVLAELKLIRPWKRTGDFDNYAKAVADAIQHGMLKDDCLIITSTQNLYYSIKPHVDVEIIYYDKFPDEIL